ncbi:MAG: hypothetical protein M3T96_00015 [Acidobacteriota bacterium]|nr:hypothetical protein [Acidobacteriota bacterium]
MKSLSETEALEDLRKLKSAYQTFIRENYEHRARSCADCPTIGVLSRRALR